MKNRGLTLPEVMISMVIGSIVMMALVRFSVTVRHQLAGDRKIMGVQAELRMAHDELMRSVRALEPEFFEAFPAREDLIHSTSHVHGPIQYSAPCPVEKKTHCALVWDLKPTKDQAMVYEISEWVTQDRLHLTPSDPVHGPGPNQDLVPMSTLLFTNGNKALPALVETVEPGSVILATREKQPWNFPETIPRELTHAVHIGILQVTHIHLRPDKEVQNRIARQPWVLAKDGWKAGRRKISHGHLRDLIWLPCGPTRPDRLVLVAGAEAARLLPEPLILGEKIYHREVACASLEF